MSELPDTKYTESIARRIVDSRREVSILFTDIEFSTMHWSELGDVEGRLMVDHHNRLVFPVIKGFHGKVIKTIGDAVMASFKRPEHALKAAIGIQQVLRKARESGEGFCCSDRIGIHTGTGIVERDDVFGDVVNIAAAIEGRCRGNEILLSETTAGGLPPGEFVLIQDGALRPKGFRDEIRLYRCQWRDHPSLVDDIRPSPILPLSRRDKLDLLIYMASSIGVFYFLYLKYLRYVIADFEPLALLFLNPGLFLEVHPAVPAALSAVLILLGLGLVSKRTVPYAVLRLFKGGFGFCVGFVLCYLSLLYVPVERVPLLERPLFESRHLFVEVLEDNTALYERPATGSAVLRRVDAGTLLLLTDVVQRKGMKWNKVLLEYRRHGWVQRVLPPRLGVPKKRLTYTDKFYFRLKDLLTLAAGLAGLVWGVASFRIRPL